MNKDKIAEIVNRLWSNYSTDLPTGGLMDYGGFFQAITELRTAYDESLAHKDAEIMTLTAIVAELEAENTELKGKVKE